MHESIVFIDWSLFVRIKQNNNGAKTDYWWFVLANTWKRRISSRVKRPIKTNLASQRLVGLEHSMCLRLADLNYCCRGGTG